MILSLVLAFSAAAAAADAPKRAFDYPEARRDPVVDVYHGARQGDPFRWLEDPAAPETRRWIDAQNKLSRAYLDATPVRRALKERMTALWDFPRFSVVKREGDRYFFSKNDGLQNQSVLYMKKTLDAEPQVVLDPNALSADGTVAVMIQSVSWNGKLLAYGLASKGSDWQELRVRRVDDGTECPEVLKRLRFSSVAWAPDDSGFFYDRYPDEGAVPKEDETRFNRVYWHALGTPQSQDKLVFERPDEKDWNLSPEVTEDGKYLILTISRGTDRRTRIYYRELGKEGEFKRLIDEWGAKNWFIHNEGPVFYLLTELDAPRGRVVAVDTRAPTEWKDVLPQTDEVLTTAFPAGGRLVASTLKDAHSRLRVHTLQGKLVRAIELPTLGSVVGLSGRPGQDELFYAFSSFLFPTRVYRHDLKTGSSTLVFDAKLPFDVSSYETRQVFYASKDGTKVPMFLTHKKGLALDGSNPTLLYGYGGFKVSITPSFSIPRLAWLERGGVYAVANLRGGDEYGEEWHQAGMLAKKQNVFDDFIAAAEWLHAEKVTRPDRLAIQGGSNGGLLVGAVALQRPELFGAGLCQVPVTDMFRYHRHTVGHMWVNEYGSADNSAEEFRTLRAYSPLHNARLGAVLPALLVTAADTDDRVVPSHAKKFVAALQAVDTAGLNPILLRYDVKAGHGGGKPTAKVIEEQADLYAFLVRALGMSVAPQKP